MLTPYDPKRKKVKKANSLYPCSFCDKIFENIASLLEHEEIHERLEDEASQRPHKIPYRD